MAEGHEGKALMRKAHKQLLSNIFQPSISSAPKGFLGPFVLPHWTTESLAAHGQGWATAAGQPWKKSCSVIIQAASRPRTTHNFRSQPPLLT